MNSDSRKTFIHRSRKEVSQLWLMDAIIRCKRVCKPFNVHLNYYRAGILIYAFATQTANFLCCESRLTGRNEEKSNEVKEMLQTRTSKAGTGQNKRQPVTFPRFFAFWCH